MYAHQDWTPVILRKTSVPSKTQHFQKPPKYQRGLDDEDVTSVKQFEKEYIQSVIKARIEKKWTQKDLATAINQDTNRISRFEQAKEPYDHQLKAKINKVLNIKVAAAPTNAA
jgi:ribosome-binding protein aMBF1 (putative translation factor)